MRWLSVIFLLVLCQACGSNTVPKDVIPVPRMETILWQLMQADEYTNTLLAKDSLKKRNTEKMKIYQQVFALNGTTLDVYKRSYQYYMENPGVAKQMFDSISARANRRRTEMYSHATDTSKVKPPVTISIRPDSAHKNHTPGADSLRAKGKGLQLNHIRADSLHRWPKDSLRNKSIKRPGFIR